MTINSLVKITAFFGLVLAPHQVLGQAGDPNLPPPPGMAPGGEQKPRGADAVPSGEELVNMDFPELTDIKDIIRAVSLWTGKNVILDNKVNGKVQIISPEKVTKEEAYQAFLSALNVLNLTTVETGKIIKILPIRTAVKGNLKTFMGSSWTPRTDEIITQIVPLKYVDAKKVQSTLARIVSSNAMIAYQPTNTLIISDSGYKVRRVLEILQLLDVQGQQPQVAIIPIKHADAKSVADKLGKILQASKGSRKSSSSYHTYKVITDDRSNSVIIFGPPRTIKDIRELVKKFDIELEDPSKQASIHVRPLDFADAKKIATTLSALASSGSKKNSLRRPPTRTRGKASSTTSSKPALATLGDGVKITADESSNSLLITGSRAAYEAVDTIIRKLDKQKSQVFVEADILDINVSNGFNFGTSIFGGFGNRSGEGTKTITAWQAMPMAPLIVSQAGTNSTAAQQNSNLKDVAGAFATDMTIGILSGAKVNVPGLGTFSPGALIKLLKTDDNSRVLASPHILTSNNEEAAITVGEKVFFPSSEFNATTGAAVPKAEKENVDLTLNIKPNISYSSNVTMKIEIEASSIKGIDPTTKLPQVNKRKTKQIVTANNGQTIVISGLVARREFETFSKIPLLGDIPILGWLFRNSQIKSDQSNLSIFLTPHVIHGSADLAAIYKRKRAETDDLLRQVYGQDGLEDDFYRSLPTLDDKDYEAAPQDEGEAQREKEFRSEETADSGESGEAASGDEDSLPVPVSQDASAPEGAADGDQQAEAPAEPTVESEAALLEEEDDQQASVE